MQEGPGGITALPHETYKTNTRQSRAVIFIFIKSIKQAENLLHLHKCVNITYNKLVN